MAHYVGNNPVNYVDPTGHKRVLRDIGGSVYTSPIALRKVSWTVDLATLALSSDVTADKIKALDQSWFMLTVQAGDQASPHPYVKALTTGALYVADKAIGGRTDDLKALKATQDRVIGACGTRRECTSVTIEGVSSLSSENQVDVLVVIFRGNDGQALESAAILDSPGIKIDQLNSSIQDARMKAKQKMYLQ